jgi:hypothetical protein
MGILIERGFEVGFVEEPSESIRYEIFYLTSPAPMQLAGCGASLVSAQPGSNPPDT